MDTGACGTIAGYSRHRSRGDVTCDECRAAMRDYVRRYRPPAVRAACLGCGKAIRATAKMCRACYHRPNPHRHRDAALRKLAASAIGSRGTTEWVAGPCAWCGSECPPARATVGEKYCSPSCRHRMKRMRRRGREFSAPGQFTWAQVLSVFRRFDARCAYCGSVIPLALLEPDHVVPLSRGGLHSLSNILPSCKSCNSDKRDLLLSEWSDDRARRGLPVRQTSWSWDDARVAHLAIHLAA